MAERAKGFWVWLDGEGRFIPSASCEVRIKGTSDKIAETIYALDDTDLTTLSNPFTTDSAGQALFYLTDPARVDLFFSKSGQTSQTVPLDVTKSAGTGPHALVGSDHTASGLTTDHVLKATAATTFGFGVDPVSDKVTTAGDLLKATGADTLARFAKGSALQVLRVNAGGTDLEYATLNTSGIQETLLDAKGDLIVASAADTAARLAIGANDTILMADSGEATGAKWAAAASTSEIADTALTESAGTSDTWARGDHVHKVVMGDMLNYQFARKTGDTSRDSTTTVTDDPHLLQAIGASDVWLVRMRLRVSVSDSPDLKFTIAAPSGAAGHWFFRTLTGSTVTTAATWISLGTTTTTNGNLNALVDIDALVVNSTNAGNISLQWAQGTSDVTPVTVEQHSYAEFTRVA